MIIFIAIASFFYIFIVSLTMKIMKNKKITIEPAHLCVIACCTASISLSTMMTFFPTILHTDKQVVQLEEKEMTIKKSVKIVNEEPDFALIDNKSKVIINPSSIKFNGRSAPMRETVIVKHYAYTNPWIDPFTRYGKIYVVTP